MRVLQDQLHWRLANGAVVHGEAAGQEWGAARARLCLELLGHLVDQVHRLRLERFLHARREVARSELRLHISGRLTEHVLLDLVRVFVRSVGVLLHL